MYFSATAKNPGVCAISPIFSTCQPDWITITGPFLDVILKKAKNSRIPTAKKQFFINFLNSIFLI